MNVSWIVQSVGLREASMPIDMSEGRVGCGADWTNLHILPSTGAKAGTGLVGIVGGEGLSD